MSSCSLRAWLAWFLVGSLCLFAAASPPRAVADAVDDACWSDAFAAPFPEGDPYAAVTFGGRLVVGGYFVDPIGGFPKGLLTWDGQSWERLGEEVYGAVRALTVWNGQLYAGGDFIVAGSTGANRLAVWNGTHWQGLGQGLDGPVSSLIVHGGELIAGGEFSFAGTVECARVAAWNGVSWRPLAAGFNEEVDCLVQYDGELIAGGKFTRSGTAIVNGIAAWNGSTWRALGWGVDSEVHALAVHEGSLIVAGSFNWAGPVLANGLAAWNGANWASFGVTDASSVSALLSLDGTLYAGGSLNGTLGVFTWDGTWSSLAGIGSAPNVLAAFAGQLVALSYYHSGAYDQDWPGIAWAWGGAAWQPLMDEGLSGAVSAFIEWNGLLVAGGDFTLASGQAAGGIAAWNGSHWQTYAGGFALDRNSGDAVLALAVYDGELYAGGRFEYAAVGGQAVNSIARWDGAAWAPLGQGLARTSGSGPGKVRALATYAGTLVVGGAFRCADLDDAYGVAAWNGSAWERLGNQDYSGVEVHALEALPGGGLLVAGDFTYFASLYAHNAVLWNGSAWSEFAGGLNDVVYDTCLLGQEVVLAGRFSQVGGASDAAGLAAWSSASGWNPLIAELSPAPYSSGASLGAIAVHDDHLVASGSFSAVDGVAATNIAYLDATGWLPMGSGVEADGYGVTPVSALQEFQEALYVGGLLTWAGGKPSFHLARYDCGLPVDATDVPAAETLILRPNFPNPFNPSTTIAWIQPAAGEVSLCVVDIGGRRIRTLLVDEFRASGPQAITWDGRDDQGSLQSSGVYFCRLDFAEQLEARSMTLVK